MLCYTFYGLNPLFLCSIKLSFFYLEVPTETYEDAPFDLWVVDFKAFKGHFREGKEFVGRIEPVSYITLCGVN